MIPKLHYKSQGKKLKEHLTHIQNACSAGAELVQLRLEDIPVNQLLKAAKEARDITAHFQTRLIIKDHYKIAKEVKADGVHLNSASTSVDLVRKHLYSWQIVGGTAHTLEECEDLLDDRVNYISLGPFRTSTLDTKSLPALGINGFTAITDILKTGTPLLGFGKITTDDVSAILATGISGIAVSDAITRNFNSIRTFNQLLKASSTEEQRYTLG